MPLFFPCGGCSWAVFCSLECRDQACDKDKGGFHSYECGRGILAFVANCSSNFLRLLAQALK